MAPTELENCKIKCAQRVIRTHGFTNSTGGALPLDHQLFYAIESHLLYLKVHPFPGFGPSSYEASYSFFLDVLARRVSQRPMSVVWLAGVATTPYVSGCY